jgi:phage terminase small subunit
MQALTVKEKRFADIYLTCFNASKSAREAGYSKTSCGTIGYEVLRKPHVSMYIQEKLKGEQLDADQTVKMVSDIARANLNEYFITREEVYTPQIFVPLKKVIAQLEAEIEDAEEFIIQAKITDADSLAQHAAQQKAREFEIIKLEIELKRNPKATRLMNGKPQMRKVAELDLPRLVADKEAGKIKSIKHTEHGINVELYAADAALTQLLRVHGKFQDKVEVDASKELKDLYKSVMKKSDK